MVADAEARASATAIAEGFASVANTCHGQCKIDAQVIAAALGTLFVEASASTEAWVRTH